MRVLRMAKRVAISKRTAERTAKDSPTTVHPVTFGALMALPDPNASTNRNNWTAAQKAVIAPFEGAAVSVVGFIGAVKKQYGGGGESTNCHFNEADFVDVHVPLVESAGHGEEKALVVEPTPRFYATHPTWKWATLNDLDDSPDPVRITGWLLFDPVHKGHLGTFSRVPLGNSSRHEDRSVSKRAVDGVVNRGQQTALTPIIREFQLGPRAA
jgi:hypothetical protein